MAVQDVAAAIRRVETVLRRRPETGLHDDATGIARWDGGTRIVASHANGQQVLTDMPTELGGTGDQVSPGWLLRAGLASCAATTIALHAASAGIVLDSLEVAASSRSDTRGFLGLSDADGVPVYPGPQNMQLLVRIAARNVPAERLQELVEKSQHLAPMSSAIQDSVPMALKIEILSS